MSTEKGLQQATGRWDEFALASAAPLGPFVRAHLAPRIPPDLLNSALVNYLPLADDEILLAIIDSGGHKPTRSCALTTRRVYWTEKIHQPQSHKHAGLRARFRARAPELTAHFASYADLPERMRAFEAEDGSSGIELGNSTTIVVGTGEGALASALLRYLETMRSAARARELPTGGIDPELASRAARALPEVVKVTAEARAFGLDLLDFRSSLESTGHHEFVTPALIGACALAYFVMVATGVPAMLPSADQLLRWAPVAASRWSSIANTGGWPPQSFFTAG